MIKLSFLIFKNTTKEILTTATVLFNRLFRVFLFPSMPFIFNILDLKNVFCLFTRLCPFVLWQLFYVICYWRSSELAFQWLQGIQGIILLMFINWRDAVVLQGGELLLIWSIQRFRYMRQVCKGLFQKPVSFVRKNSKCKKAS